MNLGQLLKTEFARLAKKISRAEIKSTRTLVLQQRHSIAALKRESAALKREVASLRRTQARARQPAPRDESAAPRRFVAKAFKAWRERAGVSGESIARAVGVTTQSIYNWEHGSTKPRPPQLAAIAELRALGLRELRQRLAGASEKSAASKRSKKSSRKKAR
jgi:DNA-binding transcriptional regulator YiaG